MNAVNLIRHRAAWTESELARAAGTSQPTIAAYDSELKSPTFRTLERLAAASISGDLPQYVDISVATTRVLTTRDG